jgi:DNA polymerase
MSCFKCDLSINRKHVVLGSGNKKASIMIIGEAPGYHEDKTGTPFIGNSGKYLRLLLSKVNITEENSFITNVVKCRPPNNRTPDNKEISICVSYFLAKEIQVVDPIFIIAAGKTATMITTGLDIAMKNCIGKSYKVGRRWVLPIYHPSYILQNDNLRTEYEDSIANLFTMITEIKDEFIFDISSNFNKDNDSLIPF